MSKVKMPLLTLIAILVIAGLEIVALLRGVDGTALAVALAMIGLLAPSPFFQLKWKDIEITKHKEDE